jgi:hypothetical protein
MRLTGVVQFQPGGFWLLIDRYVFPGFEKLFLRHLQCQRLSPLLASFSAVLLFRLFVVLLFVITFPFSDRIFDRFLELALLLLELIDIVSLAANGILPPRIDHLGISFQDFHLDLVCMGATISTELSF